MQPMRCRSNKKVWIKSEGAVGSGIGFNEPSANSVRIYLLVPRRIQRVGKVNAFSVTTYLHHLRTTIERGTRFFRKGRTTYNSGIKFAGQNQCRRDQTKPERAVAVAA